jgi:alpha-galactosidase
MMSTPRGVNERSEVLLRGGGSSLVIGLRDGLPIVLHWGRDLGHLDAAARRSLSLITAPASTHNSTEEPRRLTVLPTEADAWSGTPAIEGFFANGTPFSRFHLVSAEVDEFASSLEIVVADQQEHLRVTLSYRINPAGVLTVDCALHYEESAPNDAAEYVLGGITGMLPLPERAVDAVDFSGKWSRERSYQRTRIGFGAHLRESRRGRPSLDSPYLLMAGTEAFSFRAGEVWAVHVGWSGNQRYLIEQLPEGAGGSHRAVLGGGELLLPGEVVLRPGESYEAPTLSFAWTDRGMDGIAQAFHRTLRSRVNHPRSPRPLVLNTWEAVYFDHDHAKLLDLVEAASAVGVERVVLDDGWFDGRRDATTGLGDWNVDSEVWPGGLDPFVESVRERGMQFGLWFEPEMVNLTSRIAEQHPEWILAPSRGAGPAIRHQHVLNLAHPAAWQYVFDRIDAIVGRYAIDYIKWDHNRELHESARRDARDRAGVHLQTLALYRMLAALKQRHPRLEIESCASGGGRVDLGILEWTDRVWASDCNDPVERQNIQRWTGQLLPPELIGAHIGAAASHTTGRVTSLSFRLATALFGHAGIEMDLTVASPEDLSTITAWASLYKELRPLLHSGDVVRADLADDSSLLHGVVASDRSTAVFSWVRLATSNAVQVGSVLVPGLDKSRNYRVRLREEIGAISLHESSPEWMAAAREGALVVPGRLLSDAGILLPTLNPQQAMLIQFDAV